MTLLDVSDPVVEVPVVVVTDLPVVPAVVGTEAFGEQPVPGPLAGLFPGLSPG